MDFVQIANNHRAKVQPIAEAGGILFNVKFTSTATPAPVDPASEIDATVYDIASINIQKGARSNFPFRLPVAQFC